ncbi:MFS transporter [Streptomyces sp. NPDC126499]|uniref:MFS transporter n=1 Tax=Streptomyces sp. NPDC126499 TaxID=3155314 RepID=UPI00332B9918
MSPARGALPVLAAVQLLLIMDTAIVNVALPSVGAELGSGSAGLSWVANAYLITFGGLLLLGGRAADLLGHRRLLLAGLGLLAAASTAGGLAPTPAALVTARAAQGTGAALAAAAAFALLLVLFPDGPARHRALGVFAATGGLGGVLGTTLGGTLTGLLGWRSTFWLNVLAAALLAALAVRVLPGAAGTTGQGTPRGPGTRPATTRPAAGEGPDAAGAGQGAGPAPARARVADGPAAAGADSGAGPASVGARATDGPTGSGASPASVSARATDGSAGPGAVGRPASAGPAAGRGAGPGAAPGGGASHPGIPRPPVGGSGARRFDVAGALSVTAGLGLLAYALVGGGEHGWLHPLTLATAGGGIGSLAVFLVVERRAEAPLVPPAVWRRAAPRRANLLAALAQTALFPMFFLVSLYLQRVLGHSPLGGGLGLLPLSLVVVATAPQTGRLISRIGLTRTMTAGFVLLAAGTLWLGLALTPDGSFASTVLAPSLVLGVALPLVMVTTNVAATAGAAPEETGLASGLVNTAQQFGSVLGLAVLVAVATAVTGTPGTPTPAAETGGFRAALLVGAAFAAVAAFLAARPRPPAPATAPPRRDRVGDPR